MLALLLITSFLSGLAVGIYALFYSKDETE